MRLFKKIQTNGDDDVVAADADDDIDHDVGEDETEKCDKDKSSIFLCQDKLDPHMKQLKHEGGWPS